MLDRPSSSGFLCFIIYNLVGLWVYIWRRNEPPWCPVLFVREMGWTATLSVCGADLSLSLPTTVATLTQVKHFLFVQPSVSLISNLFNPFFEYPRTSASLLSSAVIWCFLYIRHEFDTAIVAIFIKLFSRYFPYLFLRRWRKNYNNNRTFFFFAFLWLLSFFQCCGIFHFGYCQVCCVTLSSRAFSIYVNGVKMHVQHSWKNLYLKGLNVI